MLRPVRTTTCIVFVFVCILGSVIHGSAIGPAAYMVIADDLRHMHDTNKILKFADLTDYSIGQYQDICHISSRGQLNCAKSKEIIFQSRSNQGKAVQLP